MGESEPVSKDTRCPGCHFECMLAKYQCGRGKEFYDVAAAGGEVPIRRGPMRSPSEIAAGKPEKPPVNDRVMHSFTVLANVLQRRHAESAPEKAVISLTRHGSFMSVPLLTKRALLSADEMEAALDEACGEGYVVIEDDERLGRVARLTNAGKAKSDEWTAERAAKTAEFLEPLSEDEREELVALIRKLLGMDR